MSKFLVFLLLAVTGVAYVGLPFVTPYLHCDGRVEWGWTWKCVPN